MESKGNDYIWNGDFLGETFTSIGLECYAIQPTLKEVDGQIHFTFDKQLILDLNVGISVQPRKFNDTSCQLLCVK